MSRPTNGGFFFPTNNPSSKAKGYPPRKCGLLRERTTYLNVESAGSYLDRKKNRLKTNI
jgi:hypothetical protein